MTESDLDFVLDGNAAAGALRGVFIADMTTAHIQCDACGSVRALGTLPFYAAPMGVVLRCDNCAAILHEDSPHAAWSLARNEGRALPQICSRLRG
jgi:hypothetical protein